jgi:RNA polymerase sigma-70 factor (ECF subfamily)
MLRGEKIGQISVNRPHDPTVQQTELRLVDAAIAGDDDARRALFERYRDVAYRVALRIVGRPEDALDAVQDGFIRALERLDSFKREARFKSWLLRIVSNRSLDLLRSRRVRLAVPLEDDEQRGAVVTDSDPRGRPGGRLERQELAERLRRAVDALPPDQRAVFALYATGELTYAEIAEAVGVPIGTVMSRLYHARRRLHAMLPDLAPDAAKTENE